ncbi:MAG: sigma 54-interacting transcriptional regulator [Deltaproteobacteria bacterium]|nr:sigma 54-interacting transcriptional regulator [Deltaproteobacteria bacterium]
MSNNRLNSEQNDAGRLLSLAALFKDEFSIDWLEELSEAKASQILRAMETGIERGWLKKTRPGEFCFADEEKRQALQGRLNQKEKASWHRRIVDILINHISDEDLPDEIIAHHLLHTVNDVEKSTLLMRAGDAHLKSFRTEQAVKCYNKVLEDLAGVAGEPADSLFTETAIRYSKLSMGRYDTQKVMAILKEAMARAERIHAPAYQALLKMHLAKNEWLRGRGESAFRLFNEAWAMAREIGNPKLLRSATTFRIFFFFWQGRYKEIIRVYEKSVPDVERFPHGRFPLLASMMAALCYANCGQPSQGLGMIQALETYCRKRGDRYGAVYSKNTISQILFDNGDIDQAIQINESAFKEATDENIGWIRLAGWLQLARTYYEKNEKKRSIAAFRKHLDLSKQVDIHLGGPDFLEICWAMEQGKLPQVSDLQLAKEIRRQIRGQNIFNKGVAYRYQALLGKKNGLPPEKIVRSLKCSVKFLNESGHQIELARTRIELTRQYLAMGEEDKAKETARRAHKTVSSFNSALFPDNLKSLISEPPGGEDLLNAILKSGQKAVTIRDNKALVQHIISTVNRMTNAERGAIFLLDPERDATSVKLRASKGLTQDDVKDPAFGNSIKMIEEVARTGKGRMKETGPASGPGNTAIRSRICVPLILRDKLVGVLYHDNRLLNSAFKESDLELLAYFAGQAAIALDNASAYEELQQRSDKLTEEKLYYKAEHLESLHFEDIIGESPAIKRVLSQIEKVADTTANVLVLGETGVGKELVASAIHKSSNRQKGPFIRVNLSALPESLVPSELFGHEKGAFTGATRRNVGRFQLADGGCLFLDEIGDLNMDIQVRLLRVLESKKFERIGGTETLSSDFRLIAATNHDLEKSVKVGNFRADLFYRLNVFPIRVPPLRERIDDVPLLAHYFLRIHSKEMRKHFGDISGDEMDKLLQYNWPGNVRELENVIERGAILSSPPTFTVPQPAVISSGLDASQGIDTLQEVNRRHILMALRKTKWKIRGQGGTAELLDVKPTTLEYKIKKLGIRRPSQRSQSDHLENSESAE